MDAPKMQAVGDVAFLSDCQTAAMVGRDGTVLWYCPLRFDAPSVFAGLLDPKGGYWAIQPTQPATVTRAYVADTLVLRTTFTTAAGSVTLTDALALGDGERGHEIGKHAPHRLLRRVEGTTGTVELTITFVPRLNYALAIPTMAAVAGGVVASDGRLALHVGSVVPFTIADGTATARITLHGGEAVEFALSAADLTQGQTAVPPQIDVAAALSNTIAGWQSWTAEHTSYDGPYGAHVRRSALMLQGLTFAPTGAVVAAATTSLPENPGGDANWDYRFAWLRDLSFTSRALWVAACSDETQRLFAWVQRSIDGARAAAGDQGNAPTQIMYGVGGERDLPEYGLPHLRGFADSRPVRVGNAAFRQKQLDVMGEVIDAIALFQDHLAEGDSGATNAPLADGIGALVATLADEAAQRWQDPDAGMWEARDQERQYLSSKVMCWVALDRTVHLAPRLGPHGAHAAAWATARDAVRAAVLERGWNAQVGAYTGAFDSDNLDASVLLMPLVGFVPATDARMLATIEKIAHDLAHDGIVHRWVGDRYGFVLCTFWLVECLAQAGQIDRARALFERTLTYANDVGIFAEMGDAQTGVGIGNVPQAFSHVGLINAAWALGQAQASIDARSNTTVTSAPQASTTTDAMAQPAIRRHTMAGRLQDKIALITGSDSGIGQGTAIEFAKEGAHVVITYLEDAQGAEKTRSQVEAQGRRALVVRTDTSDEAQVNALFDRAVAEFGTVDILMNNAGVDASGTEVADLTTAAWDHAIRTNLYGYFFCCRRFINIRKQAGGGGKIINISSVHEEIPRAGAADYDASKGAIRNLTRTLALELAPLKINVNNIGPGMVLTPFNQDAIDDPKVREQQVQSIPWKRTAQPSEIGRLAVFLASSDADYVTGSSYYMDGGLMQNQGQGA